MKMNKRDINKMMGIIIAFVCIVLIIVGMKYLKDYALKQLEEFVTIKILNAHTYIK